MVRMGMVAATCLMAQAGMVLAQGADTTSVVTDFDCKNGNSCSTSEKVYPGNQVVLTGSCNGAKPATFVCTEHPALECKYGAQPEPTESGCWCWVDASYENAVTVTAKVTCEQPN